MFSSAVLLLYFFLLNGSLVKMILLRPSSPKSQRLIAANNHFFFVKNQDRTLQQSTAGHAWEIIRKVREEAVCHAVPNIYSRFKLAQHYRTYNCEINKNAY